MNNCNFKFQHYEETLKSALQKGYSFFKFSDYDEGIKQSKVIFLRHDVDISLTNALVFAQIEHGLNIQATYFLRVHGNYNLFNIKNHTIIKKILEMGHEIGLHFEGDFAKLVGENVLTSFQRTKKILEISINQKINGYSIHEPSRLGLMNELDLNELGIKYHAYQDKFIEDLKYISDSSARWREGCMCSFIEKEVPKLCILTHPFWWFEESSLENY